MTDILKLVSGSEKELFVGLAGPGTGKSHTFKTIIEAEEFKGKKILVLSFINKLVDDLSAEFKKFSNVEVLTLHAFATREYKKQIKNDIDLDANLDDLISQDRLLVCNDEVNYAEKFHEAKLTDNEYRFYKERVEFYKNNEILHSFNSIIYAVNQFLKQNDNKIPSEYDLILIDEFQDFNQLEYELIELLNKKTRIILVGDDDQSLYDWKKARPDLIRALYDHQDSENFSLDNCYRCTEVIVNSVNDLVANAKRDGFLKDRVDSKKFIYPKERKDNKNEVSKKYPKIDFIPSIAGAQLIYQLSTRIKKDFANEDNLQERILILAPSYFKQTIYEGLMKNGINVAEFELFGEEKNGKIKHSYLIHAFTVLVIRKTDNLALRKVLFLYLEDEKEKDLIIKTHSEKKKIWNYLDDEIKALIEKDIEIFKKVKKGKEKLTDGELKRFSKIFNVKNLISKMIKGFEANKKGAVEVEMTTVMSSKGLSADFVYYIGIDDLNMLDRETGEMTNQKICEFLVGLTRSKKKLTLIALKDTDPSILDFINPEYINKIEFLNR